MKNMFNVTTVLPHNLLQTNPCIHHNSSTKVFRQCFLKSCDECKGSFARGCEAKRWSHWTCSSLGTIFQPMRINSVPGVKCFYNNKNMLCAQSMVWHFVRHSVYPYNKNQQDALFTFNLFQYLTSTCFKQAYCSSSGGTTLYVQQLLYAYVMCLCWLAVGRIGVDARSTKLLKNVRRNSNCIHTIGLNQLTQMFENKKCHTLLRLYMKTSTTSFNFNSPNLTNISTLHFYRVAVPGAGTSCNA